MHRRPVRGRHVAPTAATAAFVAAFAAATAACDAKPQGAAPAAGGGAPDGNGFVETAEAAGLRFHMDFLPGEQGEKFKINLYDHGTGTCVCDYDGDGDDDVYLLNQLGKNGLFRNDGTGKFTDVAAAAGVALGDRICVAAAFGDYDNDGRADLFVTSTRGGNVLFHNEGNGRFADVTAAAGVTLVAHSQSPSWFDYDADGRLDLFVTNTAKWTTETRDPGDRYFEGPLNVLKTRPPVEHNVLYRNEGNGRFTDVTAAAGVGGHGWCGDAVAFDYDGDDRLDLFVTNMFGTFTDATAKRGCLLYRNKGDGTFEDVTEAALGRTSAGAMGAKVLDFDGDGLLDLFVVDMHSDMWMNPGTLTADDIEADVKYPTSDGPAVKDPAPGTTPPVLFGNTLHRNLGGGRFEEMSDRAAAETFWPWGVASADFDQDGHEDAYLPSGMGYPFIYWPSALLMNRGEGRFADHARSYGVEPPTGGVILAQQIGGKFAAKAMRSAAVGDFDADGRPDLAVNSFNDRAYLFMNRFPRRSWTAFRLTGTKSNRDAIGALVTLTVGARKHVRLVESASGYLSQRTRTLHFGLGDAAKIDSCTIVWPSGLHQTISDPAQLRVGMLHEITEPSGEKPR